MMTDINTSIHIHIHAQLYIYNTFLSVSISQIFSKDFGQLTAVEKIHRKHHAIGLNLKPYIYKAIFLPHNQNQNTNDKKADLLQAFIQ